MKDHVVVIGILGYVDYISDVQYTESNPADLDPWTAESGRFEFKFFCKHDRAEAQRFTKLEAILVAQAYDAMIIASCKKEHEAEGKDWRDWLGNYGYADIAKVA